VSEDLDGVRFENGAFTAPARRRAVTQVSLDGDTYSLVPQTDGVVDADLWKVHSELVAQAQANRAAMLDVAAGAASSLFGALKGG
jgi:hypothetical protein